MQNEAEPPPDAAFTLTEMAVSLFLAAFVILVIAEMLHQTTRTYARVRGDIEQTQSARRIAGWLSRFERADPKSLQLDDRTISATLIGEERLSLTAPPLADGADAMVQIDYRGPAFAVSRTIMLGSPMSLSFEPHGYIAISPADPAQLGFVQRVGRDTPHDCQFDFVTRRCR